LSNEPEFEFGQADDIVALLPVPGRDVQQVGLVVVLHELNDDSDVVAVVLDGDDSHDVGRILGVGVLAVFVSQDQTGVCLMNLGPFKVHSVHERALEILHPGVLALQ